MLKGGFPYSTLLSALIFFILFLYALRIRKSPGAVFLLCLTALLSLQGVLSICELLSDGLDKKLFWRNLQQIPLYYSTVLIPGIIMSYIGISRKVIARRILIISGIICIYWIILFTEPQLIRKEVWLEPYGAFERIGMTRTPLGYLFFIHNKIVGLWALGMLLSNYRKAVGIQRTQYIALSAATLLPYAVPELARLAGLRLNVAVSMLPTAVLLFYVLHIYKFLQVRPLAKEKVIEHMSEGILIADGQDRIIDANPAAQTIKSLCGKEKLIGTSIAELFESHPELQAFYEAGKQGELEAEIGGTYFEVRFIPIRVRNTRTGSLLIFNDMTERKKYENELIRRATTDGLTKLYNRVHFFELLERAKTDCAASGQPISLMLIDVDHFKQINDQYGHIAGDRVLQHFTSVLKDCIRDNGIAGRIGGEEFAVFLPETDGRAAYNIAEELRRRMQRETVPLSESGESEGGISCTISIGVAELEDSGMSIDAWYHLADKCLYASKQNGRNRTTYGGQLSHFLLETQN
jgi:diguanylate cyclase (GGDEF)-like protein/PAS domain S-box-containing protein